MTGVHLKKNLNSVDKLNLSLKEQTDTNNINVKRPENSFNFKPITVHDISKILNSLDSKKD